MDKKGKVLHMHWVWVSFVPSHFLQNFYTVLNKKKRDEINSVKIMNKKAKVRNKKFKLKSSMRNKFWEFDKLRKFCGNWTAKLKV